EAHRPFRLEEGPVVRLRLFRRGEEEVVTLVSLHHIAIDFSSLAVVLDDLGKLYDQRTAQPPNRPTAQPTDQPTAQPPNRPTDLLPLAATYEDFSRWQAEMLAGPRGEELWTSWRDRLADAPPVLELPFDHPRPRTQSFRGGSLDVPLPESLIQGAKELAAAEGTDLGTLLLAAFQALLHRYTGRDDILVGCPVPGRPWPELREVVGFFVSSVVVRSDFSGGPSFRAALGRVRERAAEALAWQDYPFPLLVERLRPQRDAGVSPIFQVFFVLYQGEEERVIRLLSGQGGGALRTGGLTLEPYPLGGRASMFDLSLMMSESGGRVAATFQYNSDLFEAVTVARIADDYAALLGAVLADPGQPVAALPASLGEARRSASARQVPPTSAPLPDPDRSLDRAETRRALLERQKRLRSTTHRSR
ncbi:MAG TPA: condensation domain-containing protein, partial [Thermoanaerobaculia bacterium]|nr:condensation domain-containing protein [Thermoanaerobaculia bacterium]